MSKSLECPGIDCWQALLGDTIPTDLRERCEQHLEECRACQDRLHRAEGCSEELRGFGRLFGDPTLTPPDPTLVYFLERLRKGKGVEQASEAEPADLYFLQPSDRPELLGTFGDYEVQEVIGQGGMGIVLRAYEPALNRVVAIKVMAAAIAGSATARRRFTREAQAAAAVSHDHVVPVHSVAEEAGLPYLVMQYIAGESLQTRLDRSGPLELSEIVRIGLQTAQGLAAAHAQGLIHRDIKPANILLSFSRDAESSERSALASALRSEDSASRLNNVLVKITDFGLARMIDDVQLTQNGVVAGTPEYMAPEQARGEAVDHRADLFSLGSVLYAICTGEPPFRGATALVVLRRVSDEEPVPVRERNPEVPVWLEAVIVRLMAKNPTERFQSAAEVAELLEGHLAHLGKSVTVSAARLLGSPAHLRSWLIPVIWLSAAVVLLGLAVAGVLRRQTGIVEKQLPPAALYQDFRGGKHLEPPLKPFGKDAAEFTRSEEGGFRITLPVTRGTSEPVGFSVASPVEGDFEITAGYEIIHVDRPRNDFGAGLELYVATRTETNESLGCYRFLRKRYGDVYMGTRGTTDEKGKRRWLEPFETQRQEERRTTIDENGIRRVLPPQMLTASSKTGWLRLARTGTVAIFSISEIQGGAFREVCRFELGGEELKLVRLAALAGTPPVAVDLRILDLGIRTSTPIADAGQAADGTSSIEQGQGWLTAAGVVAVLIAATLLGGFCLFFRQRRNARKALAGSGPPFSQVKPTVAERPVSFRCSGCRKKLKGKPELAGKKVRCPECGTAVLVPTIGE